MPNAMARFGGGIMSGLGILKKLLVHGSFFFCSTEPLSLPPASDSIQDAQLALHVWALTAHAQEVLTAQDGFLWTHGTFQFHTLTTEHGEVPPLEGWARMWADPSDNEVRPSAKYIFSW